MADYKQILYEIQQEVEPYKEMGDPARYIPELAQVNPNKFGMHLSTVEGQEYSVGDSQEAFSIQSISKVFSLSLLFPLVEDQLWQRIGVEPSGDPFNSIALLEREKGIPRNPFLNAGAIVMADMLLTRLDNPYDDFLAYVRQLSGNPGIEYDKKVANSEVDFGYVNVALGNLMKSFGNIHHTVEEVLNFYYHQCSIAMSCCDLAHAFTIFARIGQCYGSEEKLLSGSQVKRINAIMQTCGFYDEAGEFSFRVGLPGKSGVGGGIVAVHPNCYSVATWSPRLNAKGNSVLGMKSLELLTTKSGLSIF